MQYRQQFQSCIYQDYISMEAYQFIMGLVGCDADPYQPHVTHIIPREKKPFHHIWSTQSPCAFCVHKCLSLNLLRASHCSQLSHLSQMEFPTIINWTDPFRILRMYGDFYHFIQILIEYCVRKMWSSWSDTTLCSFWSGSALLTYGQVHFQCKGCTLIFIIFFKL